MLLDAQLFRKITIIKIGSINDYEVFKVRKSFKGKKQFANFALYLYLRILRLYEKSRHRSDDAGAGFFIFGSFSSLRRPSPR